MRERKEPKWGLRGSNVQIDRKERAKNREGQGRRQLFNFILRLPGGPAVAGLPRCPLRGKLVPTILDPVSGGGAEGTLLGALPDLGRSGSLGLA